MSKQGSRIEPADPAGPKSLLGRCQDEMLSGDTGVDDLEGRALDLAAKVIDHNALFEQQGDEYWRAGQGASV